MPKEPLYPHKAKPKLVPAYHEEYRTPLMTRDQVAKWIDTKVIADAIVNEFNEQGMGNPTFDMCKKVWLDFLETELPDGIENSVEAKFGHKYH